MHIAEQSYSIGLLANEFLWKNLPGHKELAVSNMPIRGRLITYHRADIHDGA